MRTVAFGVGGRAQMRGVWELLGWQMLEGLSLSAVYRVQNDAVMLWAQASVLWSSLFRW